MRTAKNQRFVIISLFVLLAGFVLGCANREEEIESAPGSNAEADAALARAEEVMAEAGIAISLTDLGTLADLRDVLPSPLEIAVLEDSQIEEAVSSLYEALDALGYPTSPAAPSLQQRERVSDTDLAMLHLHLGYMYVLAAVARLERVKGDMYQIDFPEEFVEDDLNIYQFELTESGQARIDAVAADPNAVPADYLVLFTLEQRQAMLDSLRLLVGANVLVLPSPVLGIVDEQRHQVDPQVYRRDALYHLAESLRYASAVSADLAEALDELKTVIADNLADDMLDQIKGWGFEVENEIELRQRIDNFGQ